MTKFNFPFLLILLSLSLPSVGGTIGDLVKREGIYYKKFGDVSFTGKVEGLVQGSFKDGLTEGLWVEYYDNGQVWFKGKYKDGKREDPSLSYYHDVSAQLEQTGTFRNGEKVSD